MQQSVLLKIHLIQNQLLFPSAYTIPHHGHKEGAVQRVYSKQPDIILHGKMAVKPMIHPPDHLGNRFVCRRHTRAAVTVIKNSKLRMPLLNQSGILSRNRKGIVMLYYCKVVVLFAQPGDHSLRQRKHRCYIFRFQTPCLHTRCYPVDKDSISRNFPKIYGFFCATTQDRQAWLPL